MGIRKPATIVIILGVLALMFGAGYTAYPLLHGSGLTQATLLSQTFNQNNMDVYWEAWRLLDRDFYGKKPDGAERTNGAIRGMVETFGDPYTYFVEPAARELEQDDLRGSFGGIGAEIEQTESGFVLRPYADQPAALAGLLTGDILLLIDGVEIRNDMRLDEVVGLVRGPIGSIANLVIRRPSDNIVDDELSIAVERTEIHTPSMQWRMADGTPDGYRIGIIEHRQFTERSPEEMRQAVQELSAQGATAYAMDLRGNTGGLLNSAVKIADMWLSGGDIVIEETANGSETVFSADAETIIDNAPLVVLVDHNSASASEIVAGAIRDNGRGVIVGQTTYGKGSVQLLHELSDQSSLHVTNAQWLTPNRVQISGRGLTPDIEVAEGEDALSVAVAEVERWTIAQADPVDADEQDAEPKLP